MILGTALSGCHHFQQYSALPAPSADSSARAYSLRSLDDPSMHEFLAAAGAPRGEGPWLPQQLALVAFYYRPDLDVLRDDITSAEASVTTAGARPAVGVGAIPEQAARPEEGNSSAWTVELGVDLTVETGGKRGARIARARAGIAAATLTVAAHGWEIASDIADASAIVVNADSILVATDSVVAAAAQVRDRLHERYQRGEIGTTELARSATDLADAKVTVTNAQQVASDGRATLARVMGMSPARIVDLAVAPVAGGCAVLDSVGVDSLHGRALRTRADIGAALARYLEAEADLRLAIAEQYPDVHLGPAFLWDQGIARWLLALGVPDLVLSHARGPIVEARAHRATEAARVVVAQDSVLADVDAAIATCYAAQFGLVTADSVTQTAEQSLTIARQSYDRGESGTADVAIAALTVSRAMRGLWDARARANMAGLALQRAIGSWLTGPRVSWPDLGHSPRSQQDPVS
jgi:outer membrane protein TolC